LTFKKNDRETPKGKRGPDRPEKGELWHTSGPKGKAREKATLVPGKGRATFQLFTSCHTKREWD